jgi:hypothetical protein
MNFLAHPCGRKERGQILNRLGQLDRILAQTLRLKDDIRVYVSESDEQADGWVKKLIERTEKGLYKGHKRN